MVVDQVQIHPPNQVFRAHQRNLLRLGQIPQVEETKLPKPHQDPRRPRVLRLIQIPLRLACAIRIRLRLHPRNLRNVLPIRRNHNRVQPRNADRVPRMHNTPRLALNGLQIRGIIVARNIGVLAVHPVIQKLSHLDMLHQLRNAAHVVRVKVSDQHMINPCDPGVVHGCLNSFGISPGLPAPVRPSRIHQQRRARRRNQQRRLASLHIDRINQQVLSRALRPPDRRHRHQSQPVQCYCKRGECRKPDSGQPIPRVERVSFGSNSHARQCTRFPAVPTKAAAPPPTGSNWCRLIKTPKSRFAPQRTGSIVSGRGSAW